MRTGYLPDLFQSTSIRRPAYWQDGVAANAIPSLMVEIRDIFKFWKGAQYGK